MNRNRHLNVLKERRIKNIKRKHDKVDKILTIAEAVLILVIVAAGMFTTMFMSVGGF